MGISLVKPIEGFAIVSFAKIGENRDEKHSKLFSIFDCRGFFCREFTKIIPPGVRRLFGAIHPIHRIRIQKTTRSPGIRMVQYTLIKNAGCFERLSVS